MGGDHTLDGEPKITLPYEYLYTHMYIYKTISNTPPQTHGGSYIESLDKR